jgi:two-component system CitB family sensor kinase
VSVARRRLSTQILVSHLAILVIAVGAGFALYVHAGRQAEDVEYKKRALAIAQATAAMPGVQRGLAQGDPMGALAGLADRVRQSTGAAYVVIIDRAGVRHSHPDPALIGQRIEEPVVALDGRVHTGVDEGSLGRSANVRAPIFDAQGRPVGEVSVGLLESEVGLRFTHEMVDIVAYTAAALALGVLASLLLARAIKRVTFGLEPAEIVALVQEREAMLHGIREGVLGVDQSGRINVLNEEARRLLAIRGAALGQVASDVLPEGRLRDIVSGEVSGPDLVAVTDDHLLVLNRMPVVVGDRDAGWVVTIRDRTEMEALLRQLDSVEGLTTALRAQEHEFSNRLHVLSVLLELGEVEEATRYSHQLQTDTTMLGEEVRSRIGSPVVTALLLAKTTVAAERDVQVRLDPSSHLATLAADQVPIVTVLGNLIDNAVDAVTGDERTVGAHPRGVVTVALQCEDDIVRLSVLDSGPGIPTAHLDDVFLDGFSTKEPRGEMRRGVGLALVHRLVTRVGGTITATSPGGARFDVTLPLRARTGGAR